MVACRHTVAFAPYLLAVNPSVPVTSVKDLIAYAKARPGALSYGTPGMGTAIHIGWERLSAMAGVNLLHVPYKGGAPALIDMMGGQIQMVITTTITAGPHIKSGKVKAIAVTGEFKARFARDYAELEKTISTANIKLQ